MEDFSSKDIRRAALSYDEAAKTRVANDNVIKQQYLQYKCPELFDDTTQIISEVERDKALADALKLLPYIKSKPTTKGADTVDVQNNMSVDKGIPLPLLVAPLATRVALDESTKREDHVSKLIEFIGYVNSTGSLRGTLVLLKLLFTISEHPAIQSNYRAFLTTENDIDGVVRNGDFIRSPAVTYKLQKEIEKSNLIGKQDIINMIELIYEQDRLLNFDCYPRILLESGSPEKLRSLEIRGAVTGFIGGIFVKPNTGYSYFEVTLKGCSVGALGVRVGWGLCSESAVIKKTTITSNTNNDTNTEETNSLKINSQVNLKNKEIIRSEIVAFELPGDSEGSWTFDGSCGGHLYHNARKIRNTRMEELIRCKKCSDDNSMEIKIENNGIDSTFDEEENKIDNKKEFVIDTVVDSAAALMIGPCTESSIQSIAYSDITHTTLSTTPPRNIIPSPYPSPPTSLMSAPIPTPALALAPVSSAAPSLSVIPTSEDFDAINATLAFLDAEIDDLNFTGLWSSVYNTDASASVNNAAANVSSDANSAVSASISNVDVKAIENNNNANNSQSNNVTPEKINTEAKHTSESVEKGPVEKTANCL